MGRTEAELMRQRTKMELVGQKTKGSHHQTWSLMDEDPRWRQGDWRAMGNPWDAGPRGASGTEYQAGAGWTEDQDGASMTKDHGKPKRGKTKGSQWEGGPRQSWWDRGPNGASGKSRPREMETQGGTIVIGGISGMKDQEEPVGQSAKEQLVGQRTKKEPEGPKTQRSQWDGGTRWSQ
ncbi:hypothetical protein ROHU_009211 [Labeo rohita]|uniref:Uncharacterized protein n=1 Tax=Labeo rohita TaxID=84645 RepID=A0A498M3T0_LABRO|nr:hypothetical protein ROHU_009211 [Labeo rohita]